MMEWARGTLKMTGQPQIDQNFTKALLRLETIELSTFALWEREMGRNKRLSLAETIKYSLETTFDVAVLLAEAFKTTVSQEGKGYRTFATN